MNNSEVNYLQNELSSRGYIEQTSLPSVYKIVASNDTSTSEIVTVEIPYNTKQKSVNASIILLKKDNSEALVYAVRTGDGSAFKRSVDLLKANATFKEINSNLTVQGFDVENGNAAITEVITKDSDVMAISMKVKNVDGNDQNIYAVADMKKNAIMSIDLSSVKTHVAQTDHAQVHAYFYDFPKHAFNFFFMQSPEPAQRPEIRALHTRKIHEHRITTKPVLNNPTVHDTGEIRVKQDFEHHSGIVCTLTQHRVPGFER